MPVLTCVTKLINNQFSLLIDYKRPVDFYWHRGEERIPAGHRKGHIDALRYQINDKPHNQIRISKQLPEVRFCTCWCEV